MTISNSFVPNRQTVTNITNANPGVVTTSQPNGYHDGLFVRFFYPVMFGMTQIAGFIYQIKVLSPTTFSIDVDTSNFDAFAIKSSSQTVQVIPVAEVAATLVSAVVNNHNIIPET